MSGAPLDGRWDRIALRFAGREIDGAAVATWLQAGPWFADIRTDPSSAAAADGVSAFAGRLELNGMHASFRHDLSLGPIVEDRAEIEQDGDRIVERGLFVHGDHRAPFEEEWRRRHGPPHRIGTWRGGRQARLICVDNDLILIARRREGPGEAGAALYERDEDGWAMRRHAGLALPARLDGGTDRTWALAQDAPPWLRALSWMQVGTELG